jgi:putative nucleotidyltransferase with HDIG domain
MNKKHIRHFQSWFNDYVSNFYLKGQDQENDWAIQLKEEHSWKVREEIIKISQRLQLSEDDILIAEILGLFHDIGRFQQYEKYRTFRDDLSENHAQIGARIVEHSQILKDLNADERNIITNGILYHNVYTLPGDLDPRCLFFANY